jgi:hypothetical protein
MSEENLDLLNKRLAALEEENKNIRQQLKEDEEIYCDRLVIKAREKLLTWLKTSSILLGLSTAIVGVAFIIWGVETFQEFKQKIEEIDLTEPVKQSVDKQLAAQINQYSQETLKTTIESEVKSQVALALGQSEPKFFVVAGSSKNPSDLAREYERAKKISGSYFGISKREVRICEPKESGNNYALVIDSELTFPKAEQLVIQARSDNFRAINTYPISTTSAFFDINNCQVIQKANTNS